MLHHEATEVCPCVQAPLLLNALKHETEAACTGAAANAECNGNLTLLTKTQGSRRLGCALSPWCVFVWFSKHLAVVQRKAVALLDWWLSSFLGSSPDDIINMQRCAVHVLFVLTRSWVIFQDRVSHLFLFRWRHHLLHERMPGPWQLWGGPPTLYRSVCVHVCVCFQQGSVIYQIYQAGQPVKVQSNWMTHCHSVWDLIHWNLLFSLYMSESQI